MGDLMTGKRIILIGTLCSAVVVNYLFSSPLVEAACPPCFNNQVPLLGHGGQPGDGRRRINVRIGTNWGVPTNSNVWNGVNGYHDPSDTSNNMNGAIDKWNIATDGPPNFNKTIYYFRGYQTDDSSVDILITKGLPGWSACAEIQIAHGLPYTIVLNADAANWPADWVASIIAHELGHAIGLGNYDQTTDPCSNTIMNGHKPASCEQLVKEIQHADVSQSNRNADTNTRPSCEATAPTSSGDPGGGDPCGGDPCCGDPCCGDPCCYDSCCGDPCCGDPNCGQQCDTVCTTYCYSSCSAYDDYGYCYYWENVCETSCETQCY